VREFVSKERTEREVKEQIAAIETQFGTKIDADTIAKWRESGITDPVKALGVIAPLLKQAAAAGAGRKAEVAGTSTGPAKTEGRTFSFSDPDLTTDDHYRLILKGYTGVE
jgi:hypothetical protein